MAEGEGPDKPEELGDKLRKRVRTALTLKTKGTNVEHYTALVRDLAGFKRRVEADSQDVEACFALVQLLQAVTGSVSVLRERKHDALLAEVLGIRMWLVRREVRTELLNTLVNLMVANGAFLHNCLQALLFSLLPPPGPAFAEKDEPGTEWKPSELALEVQGHVLGAIEKALQLIPTLPSQLLPMLLQNLPHKIRDRPTQCLYLRALLDLAERGAGAALRDGLLLGVMDHLLGLDVEIKWEDIVDVKTGQEQEEGSSEEEEDHEDIFELEGMQELDIHGAPIPGAHQQQQLGARPPGLRGGWEGGDGGAAAAAAAGAGGVEGGAEGGVPGSGMPPVDEAVDKLDSMMELVLEHIGRRCAAGQTTAVWHTLLAAFERSLLHTHRSKFTQYLIFRACAEDPARCCGAFATALLARLRDARQPPITRSAAAAYLASFLARCALVPEALVVDVLQQLAKSCGEYVSSVGGGGSSGGGARSGVVMLTANGSSGVLSAAGANGGSGSGSAGGGGDLQKHQVFYAMVQALLYVLCYHMEPLVHQQRQHPGASAAHAAAVKALVREQVVPLLSHPRLSPLAVCLPSVSAEFVRQAAALKLADLAPLLQQLRAVAPGPVQQQQGGAADGSGGAAAAAPAPLVRPAVRPLEMFFPFDPYLLRRSSRFLDLEKTYVRWRSGHPHAGGTGAEEEDEEDEGVEGASEELRDEGDDESSREGSEGGSGSSSGEDESEGPSSSDLEDEGDQHMAASLDAPDGGLTPPGMLGAGVLAGAGSGAKGMHRAASIGGLRPVGQAAAARQREQRLAAAGLVAAGTSPDAMMLGTSFMSSVGLGDSYGAGAAAGTSPDAAAHVVFRGRGLAAIASPSPGAVTPLGASPAPMSYTPYDSYMQNVPAHLNTRA